MGGVPQRRYRLGAREVPPILLAKPRIVISCGVYGSERRVRASAGYAGAVRVAGGIPLYAPAIFDPVEWVEDLLGVADGLLLTGGGDVSPDRYGENDGGRCSEIDVTRDDVECALVRTAVARHVPVLGICRGAQLLNVALGGALCQDIATARSTDIQHNLEPPPKDEHRPVHRVDLVPGSSVHACYNRAEVQVNSMHHQCIERLGEGLVATGVAPDSTIEALEATSGWVVGVQWHPERMYLNHPEHTALFEGLVAVARSSMVTG